jgi:hypothetical protein
MNEQTLAAVVTLAALAVVVVAVLMAVVGPLAQALQALSL